MSLLRRIGDYAAHPDPLAAASNQVALIVAWNQPFYPLYLWWIVGGDWWVSAWTFLSTPFFACVPIVARRSALSGRAMLLLAGIANGVLSIKAFGDASGVALFLIPCGLIALLAFRRSEQIVAVAFFGATAVAVLTLGHDGSPLGHFDADQYARFWRLNGSSAAALSAVILWSLIRARASSAQR